MTRRRRPVLDIRIRFGNAAMLTPPDAADALEEVVYRLRREADLDLTTVKRDPILARVIHDTNGNVVGEWSIRHRTLKED